MLIAENQLFNLNMSFLSTEHADNPQMSEPDETIWPGICEELGKKVGEDVVDRWFADGTIVEMSSEEMRVRFPTPLHVTWAETYYRSDLESVVAHSMGRGLRVRLESSALGQAEQSLEAEAAEEAEPDFSEENLARLRQSLSKLPTARVKSAGLNPSYSFDAFVVGDNSTYCHAGAIAVASSPGERYNPMLIYGGPGLGKTHLMTAIGLEVLQKHPKKRVVYLTGEQFTNEFIEALQMGKLPKFRAKYRNVDLLLIDDIQFLAGKDSTQEEFFHTFNTLINHRSQVVLTSDRAPAEIPRLEKRLVSRFQWGIAAELLPPGVETRIAILRRKAAEWKVDLDHALAEYLATRVKKNVRNLESALLRVSTFVSLYRKDLVLSQVDQVLEDILLEEAKSSLITLSAVQQEVASHYDVRLADLSGRSRTAAIVKPRQVAMFLCRELTGASLKEVGQVFGGRDHGTVIHACKKVSEQIGASPEMKRTVEYLKARLQG